MARHSLLCPAEMSDAEHPLYLRLVGAVSVAAEDHPRDDGVPQGVAIYQRRRRADTVTREERD